MDGLKNLNTIPEDFKNAIINDFGTLMNFYYHILENAKDEYSEFKSGKTTYKYEEERDKIVEKYEVAGFKGVERLVSSINEDFGDIIVKRVVDNLNAYLTPLGTNFSEMQQRLRALGL